ncbi:hypothetical protein [Kaistella jeonii]|uniref:Uncharacterized protein n=1 Tax=Kaistella jeonii TaxID=266749 RepID=A0A0C1CYS1_9FLAO|nr:hypothetical protein [Kaistella jeonii]KIA89576.1 hypothetical protein OA86_02770 [Kaistella jeonii]SFB90693.1 hypothetical protein SAMN05421876_103346 [Kaistella jeonii]VEI95781.1 Uncharacterised protein [Kaistella jeonii]
MNEQIPEIILFQKDENALGYKYQLPTKNQLSSSIEVKSIDYDVEDFSQNFELIGGRPKENSVYYLHPYRKNTYVHESQGENYFIAEKIALYRKIGFYLGAKKIDTKITFKKEKRLITNADGTISYNLVDAEIKIKTEKEEKYKEEYEIHEDVELQDNFDLKKNLMDCRKFIKDHYLGHETELLSLIDFRDSSESGVLLTKKNVITEITSEYNNLLEISAKLSSPVFSVSTNFKSKIETLNIVNIDITYNF